MAKKTPIQQLIDWMMTVHIHQYSDGTLEVVKKMKELRDNEERDQLIKMAVLGKDPDKSAKEIYNEIYQRDEAAGHEKRNES